MVELSLKIGWLVVKEVIDEFVVGVNRHGKLMVTNSNLNHFVAYFIGIVNFKVDGLISSKHRPVYSDAYYELFSMKDI